MEKEGNKLTDKINTFLKLTSLFFQKLAESLTLKERILIVSSLFIFFGALAWHSINFYLNSTEIVPANGGTYIEGIIGKPEYLNPVLAKGNEADASLSEIIYSGLMKYDEDNQLVNDIASGWEVNEEKLQYTINLKEDVFFHDGEPLTAEDVIFTINTIQNPRYQSPLRLNWIGVEAEARGENQIIFTLKKPFVPFLHNLTFGILPKHIWQDIKPEEFPLSEFNRAPIGTGPYYFYRLEKDRERSVSQIILKANLKYHLKIPYLKTLLFKFYPNEETALTALKERKILAINDLTHHSFEDIDKERIKLYQIFLPRYYAVFFNTYTSENLADDDTRKALAWATCKDEIVDEVLYGKGKAVDSPVLTIPMDGVEGFDKRGCSSDKAKEILENAGWELKDYTPEENQENNETDTNNSDEDNESKDENQEENNSNEGKESENKKIYFDKEDNPLKITLTTTDYPELIKTAEIIKQQWEEAGILTNLEILSIGDLLNSKIETREYEALLFGETLKVDPDPRPYWHSGERKSPGQNLANYKNEEVDTLLDKGRQETNEEVRDQIYREFQLIINKEIPAIFLYSPYYLFPVDKSVQGINLESIGATYNRYSEIVNWHLENKRIKK
jgi:peptide/nickel transport system substrate-binding protein